jgi:hypothetical protein
MVSSAPRIDPRLVVAITRIDDRTVPIAEICRRIGTEADSHGLTRPSYERVRALVHLWRELEPERRGPSMLQLIWEGGLGVRGYSSVVHQLDLPREDRR